MTGISLYQKKENQELHKFSDAFSFSDSKKIHHFFPLVITYKRNIEESRQNCEQQNSTKYRMLPTQKMIDDFELSDESDIPTLVNFMMDLGESTDCGLCRCGFHINFTDRNVLSI